MPTIKRVEKKAEQAILLLKSVRDNDPSPQERSTALRKARVLWSDASMEYYDVEAKLSDAKAKV